jgi:RimJ/RimL family protein N-acetyltransferase
MLEAELAIVPASGILFEVLAAGCVAISGSYIDNQKFVYDNFSNARYIVDAGSFSYERLYDAISGVSGGGFNKLIIIDGQTAIRVSKLFNQLQKEFLIKPRRATTADIDLTFGWATNPVIRRFSFQQHKIEKSEHTNWFLQKLMDTNCIYSIVEYDNVPIGSIRFDIREGEAMISYLLDPAYHGQGIGQLILKKGIEWLFIVNIHGMIPISVISGDVMKTNFPSIKAFERLGFVKNEQKDNYKFEKWV